MKWRPALESAVGFSARDRVNGKKSARVRALRLSLVGSWQQSNNIHSPHFVNVDKAAAVDPAPRLSTLCVPTAYGRVGLHHQTGKTSKVVTQMTYNTVLNGAIPDLQDS